MALPNFKVGDKVYWIEKGVPCEGHVVKIVSAGSDKSESQYAVKDITGSQAGSIRKMSEKKLRGPTWDKKFEQELEEVLEGETEILKSDFDQLLDKEIHYFLHLKRLYELQMNVLKACDGRIIKNDLIYQQMLFASLDGLFVRLDNFHVRLINFLNVLKNDHLDRFKRNNKKGLAVDPAKVSTFGDPDPDGGKLAARAFTDRLQGHFDVAYDRVFPGVKERGQGRPNHADFDRLSQQLRDTLKPICDHRDTVVAHWDEKQEPATIPELKAAMDHVEGLLKDLFYLSKLGTYIFELGGMAASVKRTSKDLAALILGEHRTRLASASDMDAVYAMGIDAWGDGQDRDHFLEGCRTSSKYAKGTWFILEDVDGKPVSSLITYNLDPVNGKPAVGIGSVATEPVERRKGHAGQLIWEVMNLFHDRDGSQVFYLWADVDPEFYEKFEFVRLPDKYQARAGSTVMIRCQKDVRDALWGDPNYKPPQYF